MLRIDDRHHWAFESRNSPAVPVRSVVDRSSLPLAITHDGEDRWRGINAPGPVVLDQRLASGRKLHRMAKRASKGRRNIVTAGLACAGAEQGLGAVLTLGYQRMGGALEEKEAWERRKGAVQASGAA
jgi:hypothetical protein